MKFLRVVVCTSNQHTMDWAVWQNAFWFQDFQLRKKENNEKNNKENNKENKENKENEENKVEDDFCKDFYETLVDVIGAMMPMGQFEELTGINL